MEPIIIILVVMVGILVGLWGLFWWFQSRRNLQQDFILNQIKESLSQPDPTVMIVKQQLDGLQDKLHQSLQQSASVLVQSQEQIGQRLDSAARVVGEVQSRLGQLEEANKRIYEVGKDIASLQDILKSPKLRGGLGELFLGNLLDQVLPSQYYTLQYTFTTGQKVDAVIHFEDRLVAIDAKFPLENFRRLLEVEGEENRRAAQKVFFNDVKKHIDDIAKKYILPDEGTLDFALMYIPAENVYYETIVKDETLGDGKDLHAYAMERKVIPVSPHSFYAYLQVILEGVKGLEIEKQAQEILQNLSRLKVELEKFRGEFEKIGAHLRNAAGSYERAAKLIEKFDHRLQETPGLPPTEEKPLSLENN